MEEPQDQSRLPTTRPVSLAACEACRSIKMRCVRRSNAENPGHVSGSCERCSRTGRPCVIPNPKPLGRRKGALGKNQGLRQYDRQHRPHSALVHELPTSSRLEMAAVGPDNNIDPALDAQHESQTMTLPDAFQPAEEGLRTSFSRDQTNNGMTSSSGFGVAINQNVALRGTSKSHIVSNPLGLVADASDAAQQLEKHSEVTTSPQSQTNRSTGQPGQIANERPFVGRRILRRPGYISLGLTLDSKILENGLDHLFAPQVFTSYENLNYFKQPSTPPKLDTGPDLDPVDLGLLTMDEASNLFPIYFTKLHPINGILDPSLHTPEYVRAKSSLLFTSILAITAQFEWSCAPMAKRLRLHGDKLLRHVHTSGFKSVEIVQGYYISLLSAQPAERIFYERNALYTIHAFGIAADLGLDQSTRDNGGRKTLFSSRMVSRDQSPISGSEERTQTRVDHNPVSILHGSEDISEKSRLSRNRERTWLRILLWERAHNSASGRMQPFPETDLTTSIEAWSQHPLATSTDIYTCAFILLRRQQAQLHQEIRNRAGASNHDSHWVLKLVNDSFLPWRKTWLSMIVAADHPEFLSHLFLRYVYMHGRLWTLSFALHDMICGSGNLMAMREDCFGAAVNCCEVAVRDLEEIGEPLYCMLSPTWAMLSYAAVLALKLFPAVHGSRTGSDVELLALLAQLSLHLQRAGTTPPHRFGIAALLGQHLNVILTARARALQLVVGQDIIHGTGESIEDEYTNTNMLDFGAQQSGESFPFVIRDNFGDPFFMDENNWTGEGFTDILTDLFGQGFGGAI